jgi:endonuclease YncB( thermonuclease family)
MKVFLLIFISIILVTSVSLAINHPSFGYGGGGGGGGGGSGSTGDSRVCGDKLCSEIPGGREAWESRTNTKQVESELSHTEKVSSLSNSPRKQMQNGIAAKDVVCKSGLTLMIRSSGDAVCVKPSTAEKLTTAGFGTIEKIAVEKDQGPAGRNLEVKLEDAASSKSTPSQPQPKNCSGSAGCFTGYITRIVDGDTIYTATLKIRLSLTNTPEKNQEGYNEATEFTKKLCPVGSEILVDQDDLQKVDQYGRVLAKVFCGDKVLNSELLNNGHANILTQYCPTSEFSGEAWAQRYGC